MALGVSRTSRIDTVATMLENNARRAPGYWLQLVLATGIATLGLVLGSTAVVIGGMLVSPLMGPVVELGMGFAVGSSLLVIRAFIRVILSVVTVVGAAALISMGLPFHEITTEIAARTAPTLLDLLVAIFCALAAAYTTVRQTADTTAAAAGTAIGIALVPPICVAGFGLGTAEASVAGGAMLLFVANFSAILLLTVLSFLLLGYNQVEAATLERDFVELSHTRTDRAAHKVEEVLRGAFGSRFGMATRLLVPLVFLAVVAIPLKRALDEVAWEVRARESVRQALAGEGVRAVQSAVDVERHAIGIRLVVISSPEAAAALERRLDARIARATDADPAISVSAVPDAATLAAALGSARRNVDATPASLDVDEAQRIVGVALNSAWPGTVAGPLIGWTLQLSPGSGPRIATRHIGPPLGAAAELMLARAVTGTLKTAPVIVDAPISPEPIAAASATDTVWLATAVSRLAGVRTGDVVLVCVAGPAEAADSLRAPVRRGGTQALTRAEVQRVLGGTAPGRGGRITYVDGSAWSMRFSQTPCAGPAETSSTPATPTIPKP